MEEESSWGHIVVPRSLLGFHQFVVIYCFWIFTLFTEMNELLLKDSDSCGEIMPTYLGRMDMFLLLRIFGAG